MQRLIFQSSGPDSSLSRHAVCKLTLSLSLVSSIRRLVDLTAPTLSAGDAIIKLHPALEKGVASLYCIGIMHGAASMAIPFTRGWPRETKSYS